LGHGKLQIELCGQRVYPPASTAVVAGLDIGGSLFCKSVNRSQGETIMDTSSTDKVFTGAIPKLYDTYLVPMIFESYATDLVMRLKMRMKNRNPARVLEIAAGTGVVTRAMANELPASVAIIATDLNQAMLDQAKETGTTRPVVWQYADAMQLPFEDTELDAVICQFGAMFFPDKVKAYSEVRRVLKPGGLFLFNVWDRIAENEFADVVTQALATVFPDDPPRFMARTPHGYYEYHVIIDDLRHAGFAATPTFDTVTSVSHAESPDIPAMAYCQGTPLRTEIETREAAKLEHATRVSAEALTKRFGTGAIAGKLQAHIISVDR
jgi:ubiquinone/menaquinone biosynthesis C-methylase UbiE